MIVRILHLYLVREFLIIFTAAVAGFLLVCLVGDAAERLSRFIDAHASGGLILLFYIYQIPYYLIYILPAGSLIATLFTLGQMSRHNELTAMRASGISLFSILIPLLVLMLGVSAAAFLVDEALVPLTNERKSDIMDYQITGRARPSATVRRDVDYQGEGGRKWVVGLINLESGTMKDAKLLQFTDLPVHPRIVYRIDAKQAVWNRGRGWTFIEGTWRGFGEEMGSEKAIRFDRLSMPGLSEVPGDFVLEIKDPQQLSFHELSRDIERKRRNGIMVVRDEVELWQKTSMPLASFIIVVFGAPLACARRGMGPGLGIALGLVLYMLFIGSFYLTRSMGYNEMVSPLAAAWASDFLFAIGGVVIFLRVRK